MNRKPSHAARYCRIAIATMSLLGCARLVVADDLLPGEVPYNRARDERPPYLRLLSGRLFRRLRPTDNHSDTSADEGKTWQSGGLINPFKLG